uniref:BHLH domain-containing protein n=1 Tax=Magallana gigas TaxID=29159 RepID=K1PNY4_MAGGI
MVRGSVPMRVRRRQSDAKWRASVAMCYETLKTIIPNNEKLSKRKISKARAYILQETEKHIVNLERTLQEILDQKVKMKDKAALYRTEQGLVEANLGDLKNQFSLKQKELYHQNYTQRKRSRCNVPSDMESGLISLSSQVEKDAVVPLSLPSDKSSTVVGPEVSQIKGLPTYTTDPRPCCAVPSSTPVGPERNETFLCTGTVTHQQNKMFVQRMDQEVPHHFFLTPIKFPASSTQPAQHFISPPPGIRTFCGFNLDRTPSSDRPPKSKSPSKKVIRKMQFDNKGFTPVKMDDLGFTPVQFDSRGFTPVKLPEHEDQGVPDSPFTLISGRLCEEEGEGDLSLSDLLCTESIDQMDLEDQQDIPQQNQSTPSHRRSRLYQRNKEGRGRGRSRSMSEDKRETKEKKCRRQLEKSFYEERNPEDLELHGMESQPGTPRDYLSFCHLDEKRYSVTRGTDQGQEGYVSMATLLNSQSEVSSWSSQEVNVSQPQDKIRIKQMLSNENGMVLDLSEVNQVVPGLFLDDLLNSPPPMVHSPFLHYKGKQEEPYDDTGFFTIPEARSNSMV